jgi:phospholipid methyltransferase
LTFEQAARRLRLPLGFVLAALYFAFGPRPTPLTLAVGGLLALVGLMVRAWAAGHIVKNDRLATTGPYAHTRNPLYFGSFLIAAGFAVAAHWSLLLIVVAFFALVYGPTIERERAKVSAMFPEAYARAERPGIHTAAHSLARPCVRHYGTVQPVVVHAARRVEGSARFYPGAGLARPADER